MASVEEIAWAAGLFEGEGCIIYLPDARFQKRPNGCVRALRLGMTDRDVVDRFAQIMGCGKVAASDRSKRGYKTMYYWMCQDWPSIKRVLGDLYPYLGNRRRAKADALLADPAGHVGGKQQTHCKRGHPLRGEGADVRAYGNVLHCRPCQRILKERYQAEGRPYTTPEYFQKWYQRRRAAGLG